MRLHRFSVNSLALALLIGLSLIGLPGCSPTAPTDASDNRSSVNQRMAAAPDPEFARVTAPRPFVFPEDHGAHPDFATEWWYFTGNLEDDAARRYGYQFTLFRIGLKPGEAAGESAWRSHQLYMGHLAVSDIGKQQHYSQERYARSTLGMAGATLAPLQIWLGPWRIDADEQAFFPARLSAISEDASGTRLGIDLVVEAGNKPRVLQGERGFSQKGAAAGNASHYYSYTRLPTQGSLIIGDQTLAVSGNSWFDREWSSSALADDQAGWDWFALQLDDGRDLMFYRMRGNDGQAQSFSQGVLVDTDGQVMRLSLDNTQAIPEAIWTSRDGIRYPVKWQLNVPDKAIALTVEAVFNNQTMHHTVRYWEGAVTVSGSHSGRGYLEMSGYD